MRIIPVLDLKNGQVVRGVAGRRDAYRPVVSRLCSDSRPAGVARALRDAFGFCVAYVADLDAIGGAEPAWNLYRAMHEQGLALWVDAGTATLDRAEQLAALVLGDQPLNGIVAGLESLDSPELLTAMCKRLGPERLIFSLDLQGGQPLTSSKCWNGRATEQIAVRALEAGLRRFILLDLACVGVGQGIGTLGLCRWLRKIAPGVEITSGGGVRHVDDLRQLAEAGCDAALVASALHDGRISPDALKEAQRITSYTRVIES